MHPILWYVLGILSTLATLYGLWLRRAREQVSEAAQVEDLSDRQVELRLAGELLRDRSEKLESVAESIGAELANLATGVEGHAQLLCEAMGQPHLVVGRAEQLWLGLRRLRLFSEKILSFSKVSALDIQQLNMRPMLSALREELEEYAGGSLKIELNIASSLPLALASEHAFHNASLFLVDTLLFLEPNASLLTITASTRVSEDQAPQIEVEFCAEPEDSAEPRTPPKQDVQFGYLAARNLLESQGAMLSFDHVQGLRVSCLITVPVVYIGEAEAEQQGPNPEEEHAYGGVLILEDDRSIRNMLASELHKTGRNIFTAPDGASARSLLEATPERFELLILDQQARGESGDQLAQRASHLNPEIKVLLLSTERGPGLRLPPERRQRIVILAKPFSLMELRESIGALLSPWEVPDPATPVGPSSATLAADSSTTGIGNDGS